MSVEELPVPTLQGRAEPGATSSEARKIPALVRIRGCVDVIDSITDC